MYHEFQRPVNPLKSTFSENNILKFINKITLENIHFVNKLINRKVPPILYDWFTFSGDLQRYETCCSVTDHLKSMVALV